MYVLVILGGLPRLQRFPFLTPSKSALDPAYPYFGWLEDQSVIVGTEDADFVDVMHVNSGRLWDGCLSYASPLGHLDFYPNGGQHQPGCDEERISEKHLCIHFGLFFFFFFFYKKTFFFHLVNQPNLENSPSSLFDLWPVIH